MDVSTSVSSGTRNLPLKPDRFDYSFEGLFVSVLHYCQQAAEAVPKSI
ncbi:hypothetical protein [Algibacillus agarilyticus]|nr:hypothetical protein [Algibacillus agarilyticus]